MRYLLAALRQWSTEWTAAGTCRLPLRDRLFALSTRRAHAAQRYIRIDKHHGLVDAGIKRGNDYRSATSLGFLGAGNGPRGNLDYYRDAANHC